ncbi:hypothetical protein OHW35_14370 [Acinetobacter baumannii]|uniref:hypothetical protein n=1 Tax=Acinetobacter baumannii TaxID=470 RepID=UPI000934600A|nr:hypothetical protein [Acinetobacter baumannii]MDC5057595.1 hypothetical protein [Acinetobacter baumannii]MDV7433152.1 hypothetical protein [Acinetobacter baumannii]HCE0435596.1 hypothetical protein [Acinetobacter baumannii]
MLPKTFDEAIKAIGNNCSKQKIADLIISGQLEACFRFDGVIGYIQGFIPIIHFSMSSAELKTELADIQVNRGWLIIPNETSELYDFLNGKKEILKVNWAIKKQKLGTNLNIVDVVLLDEEIDFFELSNEISNPHISNHLLAPTDLRISAESLNTYLSLLNSQTESIENLITTDKSQLSSLLDETHPYYAPDLALGIRMWLENYRDASPLHKTLHKPNFDNFLHKYGIKMNDEANKRLREVSSPFSTWSTMRKEKQAEAQRDV